MVKAACSKVAPWFGKLYEEWQNNENNPTKTAAAISNVRTNTSTSKEGSSGVQQRLPFAFDFLIADKLDDEASANSGHRWVTVQGGAKAESIWYANMASADKAETTGDEVKEAKQHTDELEPADGKILGIAEHSFAKNHGIKRKGNAHCSSASKFSPANKST